MINGFTFIVSAILIALCVLPTIKPSHEKAEGNDLLYGIKYYLKTPRLRGLLALHMAASCVGAMIIVNTVIYVRGFLEGSETQTAYVFMAVGGGSMLMALFLPHLLNFKNVRMLMLSGAWMLIGTSAIAITTPDLGGVLILWFLFGIGLSLIQTPSGRLINQSCHPEDRAALFSANFSLSHGCWLIAYVLAGQLSVGVDLRSIFMIILVVVGIVTFVAYQVWPKEINQPLFHRHENLFHTHLHAHDEHHQHEHSDPVLSEPHVHAHYHDLVQHEHTFIIDLHHPSWPKTYT